MTRGASSEAPRRAVRTRAFTLIELLVALAIAALLLGLAIPAYQQYTLRAHRAEAASRLLELALCQERLRAVSGRYEAGQCLPESTPRYGYRLETPPTEASRAFRAQAEPRGAQQADRCGSLILEHTGLRQVSGQGADPRRCWAGR